MATDPGPQKPQRSQISSDWRAHVRSRLPRLAASAEREREIVDELAIQLESIYERERAAGATHDAAFERADREVPDWDALAHTLDRIERPCRQPAAAGASSARFMTGFTQDIRYALRAVATWKTFPAAVLMLSLSIASMLIVAAAVRSWHQPMPVSGPDRLALVWATNHVIGRSRDVVSGPTFTDWQQQSNAFEALAAFAQGELTIQRDGHADVLGTLTVTPDFFTVVGVRPIAGRAFAGGDVGTARVMISHAFWQSQYGSDPSVIGQTLGELGLPHEIIGVLPADFRFLSAPDAITLLDPRQLEREARTYYYYWVVGRLHQRTTIAAAQRDLDDVMAQLSAQHPVMKGWTATVEDLAATVAEPIRPSLTILIAIATLVLLIGVGNTVNLIVSRALARKREMAIRSALGASTGRIRRQWLIEGLAVSLAGAVLAIALARTAVATIATVAPRSAAIAGSAATVDLPPLQFGAAAWSVAIAIGLAIGIVLGTLPLMNAGMADLRSAFASAPVLLSRPRRWLLAGQSAIATLLTAIAGLLLAVVLQLVATSPGFDPAQVTALVVGGVHELDAPARARYYARILDAIRAQPGVMSAAVNDYVPLTNEDDFEGVEIPERRRDGAPTPREEWRRISADYFLTLGVPLLRGRAFTAADDERAPSVVIVNAAMARKYWGEANPIGARVRITHQAYGWSEVIGVVGDVHESGLDRPAQPMMFVPYHRDPRPLMGVFVRTAGRSELAMDALRRAVWSVDASRPIFGSQSMSRVVSDSYAVQRTVLWLASALAGLALLLIAGGTYAVVSLVTLGRRHEMGVRIALGAGPRAIARAVIEQPCALAGGGILAGLLAASLLARTLQSQMSGVSGLDLRTGAAATMIVAATVISSCAVPVIRAMRTDPTVTLKSD